MIVKRIKFHLEMYIANDIMAIRSTNETIEF